MLLLLGSYHTVIEIPKEKPITPIKSYLYQQPKPKSEPQKVESKPEQEQEQEQNVAATNSEQINAQKSKENQSPPPTDPAPKIEQESAPLVDNANTQQNNNQHVSALDLDNKTKTTRSAFSINQLSKLRESINEQHYQQVELERAQPNSGSILHGTPKLVPHSQVQESADEKRKNATSSVGPSKQIIKGDDGSCTLVEDLSTVGMEGITAVSSFSCGETKFNRNFREHMEKVRAKLGKDKKR